MNKIFYKVIILQISIVILFGANLSELSVCAEMINPSVTKCSLNDGLGEQIKNIENIPYTGSVFAEVDYVGNQNTNAPILIIALYNKSGVLLSLKMSNGAMDGKLKTPSINIPNNLDNLYVKVFIWEELESLKSISQALTLTQKPIEKFTSTIEQETGRQWLGFGYNQDPLDRVSGQDVSTWNENHWDITTERMAAISPSLVRIMLDQDYFNPTHIAGDYNWNSSQMQSVYKVFDWYKQNNIPILTGPWVVRVNGYDDMALGFVSDDYTQICSDMMYQLYISKGYTNIKYFTPTNEPPSVIGWDYTKYQTAITKLYDKFVIEGLPTNTLTGADAWDTFNYQVAQYNKSQLSSYEHHFYCMSEDEVLSGNLESEFRNINASIFQYDNTKPVFLGESGINKMVDYWYIQEPITPINPNTYLYGLYNFDYAMQAIRGGQSGALVWSLDGFGWGKDPGMWNISGENGGTTLRPWYYTWSLVCKYFKTNMKMYRMTQPDDTRIAVGQMIKSDGTSDFTIGIANQSMEPKEITVKIPDWAGGSFDLFKYSKDNFGDGVSLALPSTTVATDNLQDKGIVVTVPAQGCLLLTTLNKTSISPIQPIEDEQDNKNLIYEKSENIIFTAIDTETTIALKDASDGYVTYKYSNPSGILVKVLGADGNANNRVEIFTSPDNATYTKLETTNTASLLNGYWSDSIYSNSTKIPFDTNYIKVNLVNDGIGWKTNVSNVIIYPAITLFDKMEYFQKCYSSNNIEFDTSNSQFLQNDVSRIFNNSDDGGEIVYKYNNPTDFRAKIFAYNSGVELNFYSSPDGITWSYIDVVRSQQSQTFGNWYTFNYFPSINIPVGTNYLKIEFPNSSTWATQIGEFEISSENKKKPLIDELYDIENSLSHSSNLVYLNGANILGSTSKYAIGDELNNATVTYRYLNAGSFDIKVFGADLTADNKLIVYGSKDNVNWTIIPTLNTLPVQNDGYWVDSHYLPISPLPEDTNFLKIELINNGTGWKTIIDNVAITQ